MTNEDKVDIIYSLGWGLDTETLEIRSDYSGRGMYGNVCYGIVVDNECVNELIEQAAEDGLTGARTDSMGLNTIVYWPHVGGEFKDEEE